jgi:hypothetical protein
LLRAGAGCVFCVDDVDSGDGVSGQSWFDREVDGDACGCHVDGGDRSAPNAAIETIGRVGAGCVVVVAVDDVVSDRSWFNSELATEVDVDACGCHVDGRDRSAPNAAIENDRGAWGPAVWSPSMSTSTTS